MELPFNYFLTDLVDKKKPIQSKVNLLAVLHFLKM